MREQGGGEGAEYALPSGEGSARCKPKQEREKEKETNRVKWISYQKKKQKLGEL